MPLFSILTCSPPAAKPNQNSISSLAASNASTASVSVHLLSPFSPWLDPPILSSENQSSSRLSTKAIQSHEPTKPTSAPSSTSVPRPHPGNPISSLSRLTNSNHSYPAWAESPTVHSPSTRSDQCPRSPTQLVLDLDLSGECQKRH